MEKGKALSAIAESLAKLDLNPEPSPIRSPHLPSLTLINRRFAGKSAGKRSPSSLQSLCVGVLGKNLEDLISDLAEIALNFPADIKMAIMAIAKRRRLLGDKVLVALADSSWEILDISRSDVSDAGLAEVAGICTSLRVVDISQCSGITAAGVAELVTHCRSLETFRCGGCPGSDRTARRCVGIFKPKLNDMEGDSWEELDTSEIVDGSESLRWLVWPNIDKDTLKIFATECPRIVVNPQWSPFGLRSTKIPTEALPDITLDDAIVAGIDPSTWASQLVRATPRQISKPAELSMAEKFRLAFVERDTRLAPKRAKNARQNQRRAERDWVMMDERAKASFLASKHSS